MGAPKQIPILFSTPMVRAILNGTKTMTRRIVKNQPGNGIEDCYARPDGLHMWTHLKVGVGCGMGSPFSCPYGKKGDILWVRETWAETVNVNQLDDWPGRPNLKLDEEPEDNYKCIIYRADGEWSWCDDDGFSTERSYWKPSIFMPKAACRIFLEITDVRVERLQDISEEDCISEGILPVESFNSGEGKYTGQSFHNYLPHGYSEVGAKDSFQSLWRSINGEESWNSNPWVWAISFKIISN